MVTLWAVVASVASAAQVQILVEPTKLTQGQTGSARVVILMQGKDLVDTRRPPPLPTGNGLQAVFHSQSSGFQQVNLGTISRVVSFEYRLLAGEPGTWTVGPVELVLPSGEKLRAEPVEVTVAERSAEVAEDLRFEARIRSDRGVGEDGVARAWEGEVVLYERELATRYTGVQVQWGTTANGLQGLREAHLGAPEERRFRVDDPGGPLDTVKAVYPLVATGLGRHDLGRSTARAIVPSRDGSLFGRRTEVLMSDPVVIQVDPLPPAPPGFTGLVGDFAMSSRIDSAEVAAGESVPWTLVLRGTGSLEGVKLPPYEAPGVSVYDTAPRVEARLQGDAYVSSATFSRVLVPTEPGEVELPDLDLVVFSPTKGAYETLHVDLPRLTVSAGREGDGTVTAFGSAPAEVSDDPAVPRPVYGWGRATAPSLRPVLLPALAVAAAPGLGVLLLGALERVAAWRRSRRVEERPPTPAERMARLPTDPQERLAALDQILRLCESGSDPAEVRALRQRLGRVRFGDGAPDPTLEEDLRRLVARVEQEAA